MASSYFNEPFGKISWGTRPRAGNGHFLSSVPSTRVPNGCFFFHGAMNCSLRPTLSGFWSESLDVRTGNWPPLMGQYRFTLTGTRARKTSSRSKETTQLKNCELLQAKLQGRSRSIFSMSLTCRHNRRSNRSLAAQTPDSLLLRLSAPPIHQLPYWPSAIEAN